VGETPLKRNKFNYKRTFALMAVSEMKSLFGQA
jgi:hypothetical protein